MQTRSRVDECFSLSNWSQFVASSYIFTLVIFCQITIKARAVTDSAGGKVILSRGAFGSGSGGELFRYNAMAIEAISMGVMVATFSLISLSRVMVWACMQGYVKSVFTAGFYLPVNMSEIRWNLNILIHP